MKKSGKILPGFFDSHLHLLSLGQAKEAISLRGVRTIPEMIELLREGLNQKLIIARGWNHEQIEGRKMPSRTDLDCVSEAIPVVAIRVCGHVAIANSKTIELLGGSVNEKISGGTIDIEQGIFTENALSLQYDLFSQPSEADIRRYFLNAQNELLSLGVTKVFSDDFLTFDVKEEELIRIIDDLYREGLLKIRIIEQVRFRSYVAFERFINKGFFSHEFGSWRIGPLKLLLDGSLGGKTAYLKRPYENESDNYGVQTYSDEELKAYFDLANKNKIDVHAHAIGDGASWQFLRVMGQSLKETKRTDHRHALVHAQMVDHLAIQELKRLKIHAIVQPIFLESDIRMLDQRIGSRKKESYLFKSMYDTGINVCFGTDSPVESPSPFLNLFAAITRVSQQDSNLGPHLKEESFNLEDALKCYRRNTDLLAGDDFTLKNDIIELENDLDMDDTDTFIKAKVVRVQIDNKEVYHL